MKPLWTEQMNTSQHLPLPENPLREWIERSLQNRFVSVAQLLYTVVTVQSQLCLVDWRVADIGRSLCRSGSLLISSDFSSWGPRRVYPTKDTLVSTTYVVDVRSTKLLTQMNFNLYTIATDTR